MNCFGNAGCKTRLMAQHLGQIEASVCTADYLGANFNLYAERSFSLSHELVDPTVRVRLELDRVDPVVQVLGKCHERLAAPVDSDQYELGVLSFFIGKRFEKIGDRTLRLALQAVKIVDDHNARRLHLWNLGDQL